MEKWLSAKSQIMPFALKHSIPKGAPHELRFERPVDPGDMSLQQHKFANWKLCAESSEQNK